MCWVESWDGCSDQPDGGDRPTESGGIWEIPTQVSEGRVGRPGRGWRASVRRRRRVLGVASGLEVAVRVSIAALGSCLNDCHPRPVNAYVVRQRNPLPSNRRSEGHVASGVCFPVSYPRSRVITRRIRSYTGDRRADLTAAARSQRPHFSTTRHRAKKLISLEVTSEACTQASGTHTP
jgi:hypothetical protein